MYMKDWIQKLDDFLKLSGKELLNHAGSVSVEVAKLKANEEYDKFREHIWPGYTTWPPRPTPWIPRPAI